MSFPKVHSLGFEPVNNPCCFGTHKNMLGQFFNPDNMCGKPGLQACTNPSLRNELTGMLFITSYDATWIQVNCRLDHSKHRNEA